LSKDDEHYYPRRALFAHFRSSAGALAYAALAASIGCAVYTLLVGAAPSVVRLAIMGGLALFARQVGRQQGASTRTAQPAFRANSFWVRFSILRCYLTHSPK